MEALAVIAAASPQDQQYCLKVLERLTGRALFRLSYDEEKQASLARTLREVGQVLVRNGTSRFYGGEPLRLPPEDGDEP
jgi:hypothetical protein